MASKRKRTAIGKRNLDALRWERALYTGVGTIVLVGSVVALWKGVNPASVGVVASIGVMLLTLRWIMNRDVEKAEQELGKGQ